MCQSRVVGKISRDSIEGVHVCLLCVHETEERSEGNFWDTKYQKCQIIRRAGIL